MKSAENVSSSVAKITKYQLSFYGKMNYRYITTQHTTENVKELFSLESCTKSSGSPEQRPRASVFKALRWRSEGTWTWLPHLYLSILSLC